MRVLFMVLRGQSLCSLGAALTLFTFVVRRLIDRNRAILLRARVSFRDVVGKRQDSGLHPDGTLRLPKWKDLAMYQTASALQVTPCLLYTSDAADE